MADAVVMGCVSQVGEQTGDIARNAVLAAGFPETVPSTSVDRPCGWSQQAIRFDAQGLIAGAYDVVITAGWGIGHEESDAVAAESHRRAARARAEGRFVAEIVAVAVTLDGEAMAFAHDEGIRPDASVEALGHPVGASGARLTTTLVHELERTGGRDGRARWARWR